MVRLYSYNTKYLLRRGAIKAVMLQRDGNLLRLSSWIFPSLRLGGPYKTIRCPSAAASSNRFVIERHTAFSVFSLPCTPERLQKVHCATHRRFATPEFGPHRSSPRNGRCSVLVLASFEAAEASAIRAPHRKAGLRFYGPGPFQREDLASR